MNSSFPPLYPQEAYPEQNRSQFFQGQNDCIGKSTSCPSCQQSMGLQSNFSGGIGNLILPLLLKTMSGGNSNMQDLFKSLGGDGGNPILSALANFSNKKKPTEDVGEKQFPND